MLVRYRRSSSCICQPARLWVKRLHTISQVADFEEFAGHAKLAALALVPSDAAGRNTAAAAATGSPQNAEGGWPDMRGSSATGGGGGWRHSQATEAAAALPPAPRPKLLLLDDLPHAAGAEQRARITAAITRLAQGCSGATAVVVEMTDGGREDSGGSGRSQAASMRGLQRVRMPAPAVVRDLTTPGS